MPPPPPPSRDDSGRRTALTSAAGPLLVIGLALALSALIQLIVLVVSLSLPSGGGGGHQPPTIEGMLPLIGQGVVGVLIMFGRYACWSVWRREGAWAALVSAVATLLGLLAAGGVVMLALEVARKVDGVELLGAIACVAGLLLVTAEVTFWVFLNYYGGEARSTAVPVLLGVLAAFAALLTMASVGFFVAANNGPREWLPVLVVVVPVGHTLFAAYYAVVVLSTRQAGLAEARRIRTAAAAGAAEVTDPWDDVPVARTVERAPPPPPPPPRRPRRDDDDDY